MKKYKIYKKNNYIVVTDNITSETFYGRAKDVMVDKSNTNRAAYRFFNILDLKEGTGLTIDQILKEDGSPYTSDEFDTFYTQNTGNFNGGGTAPIIDLISTDSDNSIELGSDGKLWSGGGSGTLQQVTDNGNTTTNAIEISNYIKASEFRSSADDITFTDGSGNPIFFFENTGANQANFDKALLTDNRNYSLPDASGTIALESGTKQYKFLLSQSGGDDPQTATSGTLTQGVTYEIVAFETGDDFTPSGAPNNTIGTKWIANGVAPTWGNGSELGWNNGAPVVNANFGLSDFWFEKNIVSESGTGFYYIKSNGNFVNLFMPIIQGFAQSDTTTFYYMQKVDNSTIRITTVDGGGDRVDGILMETPIQFEIKL